MLRQKENSADAEVSKDDRSDHSLCKIEEELVRDLHGTQSTTHKSELASHSVPELIMATDPCTELEAGSKVSKS